MTGSSPRGPSVPVHPPEVYALAEMAASWVQRDGYQHYTGPAEVGEPVDLGTSEIVFEAEVAHKILDFYKVPDGPTQGGGDIDTRVAALAKRTRHAESLLSKIALNHARESGPGGTVGDYCVECDHRWPCPTYLHASGTRHENATWSPLYQDDRDCSVCGWLPDVCEHGDPTARGSS